MELEHQYVADVSLVVLEHFLAQGSGRNFELCIVLPSFAITDEFLDSAHGLLSFKELHAAADL